MAKPKGFKCPECGYEFDALNGVCDECGYKNQHGVVWMNPDYRLPK